MAHRSGMPHDTCPDDWLWPGIVYNSLFSLSLLISLSLYIVKLVDKNALSLVLNFSRNSRKKRVITDRRQGILQCYLPVWFAMSLILMLQVLLCFLAIFCGTVFLSRRCIWKKLLVKALYEVFGVCVCM